MPNHPLIKPTIESLNFEGNSEDNNEEPRLDQALTLLKGSKSDIPKIERLALVRAIESFAHAIDDEDLGEQCKNTLFAIKSEPTALCGYVEVWALNEAGVDPEFALEESYTEQVCDTVECDDYDTLVRFLVSIVGEMALTEDPVDSKDTPSMAYHSYRVSVQSEDKNDCRLGLESGLSYYTSCDEIAQIQGLFQQWCEKNTHVKR